MRRSGSCSSFSSGTCRLFSSSTCRILLLAIVLPLVPAQAALPDTLNGAPLPSLAPILQAVTPAVVNIATRGRARAGNPLMEDPFFRRFFDLPDTDLPLRSQSLGSGVIVDADNGYVITNSHVIAGASEILVTLHDGRELNAVLVGDDPKSDVAVVQVKADGLTEIDFADSESLQVGDFCIAIGNPFGLGQTVTSGIVSALGRSGLGLQEFEDFIQTDASINPGNSGGALIDLRGQLIGINSAILGPSGGNVGIGFAIPSNMVSDLLEQIVTNGRVRRGSLGIVSQPLTARLAEAFSVPPGRGIVVGEVHSNSPAERAGLQVGDVIISIDGHPVRDVRDVNNRVGLVRLGQSLTLDIVRQQKARSITVAVEALPDAAGLLSGAVLADRQSRNGRRYVLIDAVEPDSVVDQAGLRPGDILLSLNQQPVGDVADVNRIASRETEILLLVQRGRATSYVALRQTP